MERVMVPKLCGIIHSLKCYPASTASIANIEPELLGFPRGNFQDREHESRQVFVEPVGKGCALRFVRGCKGVAAQIARTARD
jgi:hypothetical protein